ncbi:MAG: hypothetical protein FIA92_09180 [Chloroflexi bacterium]|nr:hypothetical protein [Chloroflexota bacterium]
MHRRRGTLRSVVVPTVFVAIFAAACTGPTGGGAGPTATPSTAPQPTATSDSMESPMAVAVTIEVSQDPTYGQILPVDGNAVYLFTPDPEGGTGSACTEGCLANWPAVLVPEGSEPAAGAGVTGALTTFERPEGGRQVAYAGHPLYFFANDPAPGDTNGQGLNDVWFLVTPAGEAVAAAAATAAPQQTQDDDPYDY